MILSMARNGDVALGDRVRDQISDFEGVAVAKTNWLNGCERITVQSSKLFEGKTVSETFDVEQLQITESGVLGVGQPSGGDRPGPTRPGNPNR
jgi:hypothetical protein